MDRARIIGFTILAACFATAPAALPRETHGFSSWGFVAQPRQDADAGSEIRTLPAERGGQELVGRKWPAMEFDRIIESPQSAPRGEAVRGESRDKSEERDVDEEPVITLYRWWTSGCPYCESSLPAIEAWREKYEERGLRTVAIYHPKPPRPPEQVTDEFIIRAAKSFGYTGTLALDSDWSQLRAATRGWSDRRATSVSFLVDHEGVIRFVHPGLDYFASDDPRHERQNRDHRLLEAAIEALLDILAEAQADKRSEAGPCDNGLKASMNTSTSAQLAERIDSLWDFRDPETSEQRFRDAAGQQTDASHRLRLLTQVARAQGLQRRFDQAHATLDEIEAALAQHPDDGLDRSVLLMCAIERGRVFNSSGDRDRALPLFREAWDIAQSLEQDAAAVDAAHMLAIASSGDEAIEWNKRALEQAESSPDARARRWRASLHNNLGWTYHDQGDYERALDHFQRALAAREERGQTRETLIARWAVARCLRSLGRVQEALGRQQALIDEWNLLGEQDGYVFEEIGECLLLLDRHEEARPYFAQAHNLLRHDRWLSANEKDRLERLAELGGAGGE